MMLGWRSIEAFLGKSQDRWNLWISRIFFVFLAPSAKLGPDKRVHFQGRFSSRREKCSDDFGGQTQWYCTSLSIARLLDASGSCPDEAEDLMRGCPESLVAVLAVPISAPLSLKTRISSANVVSSVLPSVLVLFSGPLP